jgi:hypothetical protein
MEREAEPSLENVPEAAQGDVTSAYVTLSKFLRGVSEQAAKPAWSATPGPSPNARVPAPAESLKVFGWR